MMVNEVSKRYARALFVLAKENKKEVQVFEQIRTVNESLSSEKQLVDFFNSPTIPAELKKEAIQKALEKTQLSDEVKNLLSLLCTKDRMSCFSEIVEAYQQNIDSDNGVTRGVVKTATVLDPASQKKLEETIQKVIGKKVILTYKEDSALIGGLKAQVGGWTFDDSINSHLQKMNEDLKRRVN